MKTNKPNRLLRSVSLLLAGVFTCFTVAAAAPVTAHALTKEELQAQLEAYEQKLQQDKAALEQAKDATADAKAKKQNLERQINTIKEQISVLAETIAIVQSEIGDTMQDIADKEVEIENKETDIQIRRENFKQRMAAMQQMKDAGAMAMLSSVTNLYQLLTFSEVLQDIANKDTEILEGLRTAKAELETAKAELEAKQLELETQQTELEAQKQTMTEKQSQLSEALVQAGKDLAEAEAAQREAQELVDGDTINYEAVQSQIENLINGAANADPNLTFNGQFGCPLRTYKRISSGFGPRNLNGKKYHYGQDWAADEGTPIYAVADGLVTAAGWNSGGYGYYVLIYHGKMSDGKTYSTLYAHMCERPSVSNGQYIARGTQIGKVGTTGSSTGNHLHLELWQGSTRNQGLGNKSICINPALYIPLR